VAGAGVMLDTPSTPTSTGCTARRRLEAKQLGEREGDRPRHVGNPDSLTTARRWQPWR
jgi:hypothetical protein